MATEPKSVEEPGFIPQLIALWVRWCGRFPYVVVSITLVTCVLSLFYAWHNLKFLTERDDLISPEKSSLQRWSRYTAEFGDDDDMIVAVEGQNPALMEQALEALAAKIKEHPDRFDRLFYKVDLRKLRDRSLLFKSPEDIAKIQDGLKNYKLLFLVSDIINDHAWKNLTLGHLVQEGKNRIDLQPPGKALEDSDGFYKQLKVLVEQARAYLADPKSYSKPWLNIVETPADQVNPFDEPQYIFNKTKTLAWLLVRPIKEADSFTAADKDIQVMRDLIADVEKSFPDLKFGLTGLPVLENDEMVSTQDDSQTASWLALAGVTLLYLLVYRRIRYPLMTVACLVVGTVWALGWLTLTVGHLNILSMVFAVMLIGMGDYGILWATRYTHELQATKDQDVVMENTALTVGPSILTAAFSTGLAFFATMFADLRAVTELGWIAGCGVLMCAFSTFTLMPALLVLFDRKPQASQATEEAIIYSLEHRDWLPSLTHRPWLVLPMSVAFGVVMGILGLCMTRYDHNLLNLQNKNLASVRWGHKLIDNDSEVNWHALSYTQTREEALKLKAQYEKLPGVVRVVEIASLVPDDQKLKIEQFQDIQSRLKSLPARGKIVPHNEPAPADVIAALERLRAALSELGDVRFAPLSKELQLLADAIRQGGPKAGPALKAYEELITRDLAENFYQLKEVSKPASLQVNDLPVPLRERFYGKNGKWLLRVFPKKSLWDYAALEDFVAQIQTVDGEATGKPFTTLEGLQAMKNGFTWAGVYALIAICITLLLDFGNAKHALLALAPLALGMAGTLGVLAILDIPLNPANMIAFPLILGVGVDNGVHVLHDYRNRPKGRRYSLNFATGRGIFVAALTTILGFGTLMISSHRGQASLGFVLTLGVSCCLLAALVFLPTLLHLRSLQETAKAERSLKKRMSA